MEFYILTSLLTAETLTNVKITSGFLFNNMQKQVGGFLTRRVFESSS